jgi:hypothetical protein
MTKDNTLQISIVILKKIKPLSDACVCLLPNTQQPLYKNKSCDSFEKELLLHPRIRIVLYYEIYPSEQEKLLIRELISSYHYRKMCNKAVPLIDGDISKKENLALYTNALLIELFDPSMCHEHYNPLSNPLFAYTTALCCSDNTKNRIIILPASLSS